MYSSPRTGTCQAVNDVADTRWGGSRGWPLLEDLLGFCSQCPLLWDSNSFLDLQFGVLTDHLELNCPSLGRLLLRGWQWRRTECPCCLQPMHLSECSTRM